MQAGMEPPKQASTTIATTMIHRREEREEKKSDTVHLEGVGSLSVVLLGNAATSQQARYHTASLSSQSIEPRW